MELTVGIFCSAFSEAFPITHQAADSLSSTIRWS